MLSIPGVLFIGSLSTNLFILAESKIVSAISWFSLILSGSVVHFGSSQTWAPPKMLQRRREAVFHSAAAAYRRLEPIFWQHNHCTTD